MLMLKYICLLVLGINSIAIALPLGVYELMNFRGHTGTLHRNNAKMAQLSPNNSINVREYYYTRALVNHYTPVSEYRYWKQRYFTNDEFWGGRGFPVFLYIGGEGPLTKNVLTENMFIHALAKKHNALLVALEHRYYGKSYPTPDMSLSNLQYLSSYQALSDLGRFHRYLTMTYGLQSSKWISFGGSYPGNLAAWFKLKYPALVVGSIASSAPILAEMNFFQYMEVVGRGLRYFGGQKCFHNVEKSMIDMHTLLKDLSKRSQFVRLFQPCDSIDNELDESVFEQTIMGYFQDVAQYNQIHSGAMTLTDVCNIFANASTSPLDNLIKFMHKSRPKDKHCTDSKFDGSLNSTVTILKKSNFDGKSSSRQWFYQTCNEFGYFQSTSSSNSPFYALSTISMQNIGPEVCKRVFNITEYPDISGTNTEYGALDLTVENVTFPSGTIDPWHVLAVQNTTVVKSPTMQSVYIEGTAHCADMHAENSNDSIHLRNARKEIASAVFNYLGANRLNNPVSIS